MKTILCLVALICVTTSAAAQTTFSFAGLSWGDSLQVVDSKLKAAGFSGCAIHEKMLCKAMTTCRCQIKGPAVQEGWAELTNDKLEEVFVQVQNFSESADALKKKYGPPIIEPYKSVFESGPDRSGDQSWSAPTGETLELIRSHRYLTYTSGERNRKTDMRDRAKKSVF